MLEIAILFVLGLCLGSFVNALVFRLHEQSEQQKATLRRGSGQESKKQKAFSIWTGRSMCPNCRHQLAARDLVPVFSWLELKGKCRYCQKPISKQYPLVELATAILFIFSYLFWPSTLHSPLLTILFFLWLVILVGLVALLVYDFKWMILPNKILFPVIGLAFLSTLIKYIISDSGLPQFSVSLVLSLAVASGIFYLLFVFSDGRLIGGGDVKLGIVYGLLLADPIKSALVLFLAGTFGTIVLLPGILTKRVGLKSRIPFGPLLIMATFIAYIFGERILSWGLNKLLYF